MNGYVVTVPELHGIATWGRTEAEALSKARELIVGLFEACRLTGRPLPERRGVAQLKARPGQKIAQLHMVIES